jgi:hypothetical protein
LITGTLKKHIFYLSSKAATVATPLDLENIPFFYKQISAESLHPLTRDIPLGGLLEMQHPQQGTIRMPVWRYTHRLLKTIDGERPLREIVERVKAEAETHHGEVRTDDIVGDFRKAYEVFTLMDVMLLRHKSVPAFSPYR